MREDAASSTAYTVLQGVLYTAQSEQYAALVPQSMKRACRIILEASPEGRRRLAQLEHTLFRASVPWLERAIMPGITLHYVLRKLYIRDEVRRAIDAGCTQIVNLGAGFDPMAWELSTEFPDVTFIELDHPATSKQKAHALAAHPVHNLHWLPVDFELTDAHDALSRTESFAANQHTMFVCEGVLMYLDVPDVARMFTRLRDISSSASRFVYTSVMSMRSDEANFGWLLKQYLRMKSEPLAWTIAPTSQETFASSHGWCVADIATTDTLAELYLHNHSPATLHRGEYIVAAHAAPRKHR